MAGVIAARTLHEQGIDDFVIVEAKGIFGGRMSRRQFGVNGSSYVVEKGPNWIHGTQTGSGPANPVWLLAQKHNLSMVESNLFTNITFFDYNGPNDYSKTFNASLTAFDNARVLAAMGTKQTDLDLRSAYNYMGVAPKTPQEEACEWYQIDYDASQTSSLASAWNYNYTFDPDVGYSDVDMLSVDPRGMACIVQAEAATFLNTSQVLFNQAVTSIQYNQSGVTVQTRNLTNNTSGYTLTADHVLVTFSVGVLQGTDVTFEPALPDWKREAISNIEMATGEKFWFDSEIALYADQQKGKYPVWQSLDHPGIFPGSGIIFVTVTGDYANYLEQLNSNKTTTQVQQEVMEVLRRMYPNAPDPIAIFMPFWGKDPLFRGSYSNWGASFVPQHSYNLSAPVDGHLWFAGEGTSLRYFGFLHGAYLEGQKAATNIAACINNPARCPST
ncbi:amine oxidase [Pisolithus marmoratus]|nr:amine oxidase [Pisolithus marmoratus]